MILKIYNLDKTLLGGIENFKDAKVESTLSNGDKQLSFSWHQSNKLQPRHEQYVRTDEDEYVIKEITRSKGGYKEITARLNLEDLEGKSWMKFISEEQTAKACADYALSGTGWKCVSTVSSKKLRNISLVKVNSYNVFEKMLEAYTCEVQWDTLTKTVYLKEKIGSDKGAYFISGLNLKELSESSDTYDYVTRIIPIGADELDITGVNNKKDYLENFQYSQKIKTLIWEDTNYTDSEALMEDAKYKLDELSKPKKSYQVKIVDLAKLKPEYKILAYTVGDTVTLVDNETNTREQQRITKTVEYIGAPEKNTCDISNTVLSFEDMQKQLLAAKDALNNITTDNGTVKGSTVDKMSAAQIADLNVWIEQNTDIPQLKVQYLAVTGELGAVKATIGEIQTTYIKATDADIKYATIAKANILEADIEKLNAAYGDFKVIVTEDITAMTGRIESISGDFASYKTIIGQELTIAKGWLLEGSIGSAQISSLNANKIDAGTIDTAKVTISSRDSSMQITGNQMLVNDTTNPLNPVNRVIVGQYRDDKGNTTYGLQVRGKDGNTVMMDGDGVHNAGITDGAIDNNKVSDDANISGKKLDINSVVESINQDGSTTISQTKIQVGDKTLDMVMREQTQFTEETTSKLEDIESKKMLRTEVISEDGYIFEDGNIHCTFRAVVYSWDTDITEQLAKENFTWQRESADKQFDAYWNGNHKNYNEKTLTVTAEDVVVDNGKAITDVCFTCIVTVET